MPRWYSRFTTVIYGNLSSACCSLCCNRLSTTMPVTQAMPGYDNTMMTPMASRTFVVLPTVCLPRGVAAWRQDTTDPGPSRQPQLVT